MNRAEREMRWRDQGRYMGRRPQRSDRYLQSGEVGLGRRGRQTQMTMEKLYSWVGEGGCVQPVICLCQMKERIFSLR